MRIRIRGPQGVSTINIEETATWGELKAAIASSASVPEFDVKYGYPPKPLNTESIDTATQLSSLEIPLNGEQLTIVPINIQASLSNPLASEKHPPSAPRLPQSHTNAPKHQPGDFPSESNQPLSLTRKKNTSLDTDPPLIPVPQLDGQLVLRVMPDDNSCMFRALSSAVLGSALDGMTELRSVVAQTIQGNPELYTTGMLEKEPSVYCSWISREDSWGGGIELSILSQHFDIEIASVNVQDCRVDRFNEGKPTRCILVYSGIHYDVVAVTPFSGAEPEFDRKVFDVVRTGDEEMDGGALEAAVELCKELQSRHYYTDTHGFTVKCNQCGNTGKGQQWAVQHARSTGHGDFGEG
jgi:ubiquitin thioesterase OTU1